MPAMIKLADKDFKTTIIPSAIITYVYTKTCIQMFIVTLFVISPNWKQPRCSLMGEWINLK